jgi:hypothetical protein
MSSRRPEICIGDLVRAILSLGSGDPDHWVQIVNCLGFITDPSTRAQRNYRSTLGAWGAVGRKQNERTDQEIPAGPYHQILSPPKATPVSTTQREAVTIRVERLESVQGAQGDDGFPPQLRGVAGISLDERPPPAVQRRLLFPKEVARGLLLASVRRPVPGFEVDVKKIVTALSKARPPPRLPTVPHRSASARCQLLLDFSRTLAPWWEDLRTLAAQFQSLLGKEHCDVFEFGGDPEHAVGLADLDGSSRGRGVAHQLVIVVTDFGLLRFAAGESRPGLDVWRRFLLHCRRCETPVIAITPLSRDRCPKELGKLVRLIHWNPATRVTDIKRLMDRRKESWKWDG